MFLNEVGCEYEIMEETQENCEPWIIAQQLVKL
jgi:hypothetical protein